MKFEIETLEDKLAKQEEQRIQGIKLTAQSTILEKYSLEKQSSAQLGLYGDAYLQEMKDYIEEACQMGLMKPKKGTANGNCDITENEARAILRLLMHTNKTNKQIAEQFNLSDKHISSIRYGLRWKHLLLEEEFKGYTPSKSLLVDDVNKKLVVIHFALTTKLTNHYLGNLLKTDPSNISRIRNNKLYKSILPMYKQESSTTIENLMSPLELVEYRQATGSGVPHNEDDIV